jgi:hypothetical protein
MSTSDYAAKFLNPEDITNKELSAYLLSDFRRLFIQDCANKYGHRFDVSDFIEYAKTHTYHGEDYSAYLRGFVSKKVAEEHSAYQAKKRQEADERSSKIREENEAIRARAAAEAEAKMKERARRAYPFSAEAFEKDWDNHLRAQYAAQEMGSSHPANPRNYQRGVGGGYSEPIHH